METVSIVKDEVAETLAIAARKSISNYCYTECMAYCCRRGYLLLSAEEEGLMRNTDIDDLKLMPIRTEIIDDAKRYIFSLGAKGLGCPNLTDYKCVIHTNPLRPKACKDFPLFIWTDKTIVITDECPAVKENQLYAYLDEFKKMGYKLVYSSDKH
jgi:Fe-S-cluster containining protein